MTRIKNWILLVLMGATAATAWVLQPTIYLASQRPKVDLEQLVPKEFGSWRELQQSTGQIVNPQQEALLTKIYTQTLSRTYVNADGGLVMLSIAYGANQGQGLELHYPEICYGAQGFQVISKDKDVLDTGFGSVKIKRLMTKLGSRSEPVTYWTTLGDSVVQGGIQTKLGQIEYGVKGFIPDGLLFRVSSITSDLKKGQELQDRFAKDLLFAVPPQSRVRLAGLQR